MTFLNAYSTLRWSMTVLMYTALALPLISCGEASGTKSATLDLAAEPMPFSKPEFEAQIALPGVAVLPAVTQQVLTLRRAFFAGDFAMLEMAMMKSHNDYLAGIGGNTVANWLIADIQDTELAGVAACGIVCTRDEICQRSERCAVRHHARAPATRQRFTGASHRAGAQAD